MPGYELTQDITPNTLQLQVTGEMSILDGEGLIAEIRLALPAVEHRFRGIPVDASWSRQPLPMLTQTMCARELRAHKDIVVAVYGASRLSERFITMTADLAGAADRMRLFPDAATARCWLSHRLGSPPAAQDYALSR